MVHGLQYFIVVIIKLSGMKKGQREEPAPCSHYSSVLSSPDYYSQSILPFFSLCPSATS